MARRVRSAGRSASDIVAAPKSPWVKRAFGHFDPLDLASLERIETQIDWMLENVGIAFRDDPVALQIWRDAGVTPGGPHGDLIRADASWIRSLCATAPRQFTQLSRNPERSVIIGGDNQVFAPVYGAPFVRDLEGGRRYATFDDFEKLLKLSYMHPNLHHTGLVIAEPTDIPVSKRHLDMVLAHMTLSDKPHLGAITEMSRAQDSVDMAEILFGADVMAKDCVIMGNVNTNSPLLVDKVVTEAIRVYCGRGQGIVVVPFILSGAMGPVSTAASIVQAMAEALMVCAFSQLVHKGAPFVLGNFLSSMSLKSGAPTFGMPEPVISNYVIGQLARRANFVLHSAGWLEGGLCAGFEKLVMDADRLGSYQKVLSQGLDLSDDAFAADAYEEVAPGGHFLGSAHTMRNYQTAFYEPALSNSENVESWEEAGSKDMRHRAYERWQAMLESYVPPPMEDGTREALLDYVARRKSELPDAWY